MAQRVRLLLNPALLVSSTKPWQIAFKVEGKVQGVFFRSFTAEKATDLKLTGFVQNQSDGTVAGEAQGEPSKIKELVQHLNKGPSQAEVNKVEQHEVDPKQDETGFKGG
ncbi:MAG: hypothetical protein M1828_003061 [Chrysothrix sp. TS-e1954]|nr:MAG: hypothetical protein M1828_003061 [Chrysothrix sp. TS-e1954]